MRRRFAQIETPACSSMHHTQSLRSYPMISITRKVVPDRDIVCWVGRHD